MNNGRSPVQAAELLNMLTATFRNYLSLNNGLCTNALMTGNTTGASVFPQIDMISLTLIIDEAA
jgi:hypothetical protein